MGTDWPGPGQAGIGRAGIGGTGLGARRAAGRVVAVVAAMVLALAACGGEETNGLQDASAAEVGTRSVDALNSAGSVHVVGTAQDPSAEGSTRYDLVLSGSSARGTITSGSVVTEIVKVADDTYTKGSRAYYESIGEGDAADLLADKWVRLPAEDAEQYRLFTIEGFAMAIGEYVAALDGKVTTEDLAGRQAVAAGSAEGTRLWAANTGDPVPLRLDMLNGEQGRMEFSDYGTKVSITAPAGAVDLASLS
ncbi:hypothetical protein Ga0074812_101361 [Parafrankia irregularis]|uniref:Lipoprotein LprG n=1 Tax=Parafrankia irregularis TaxID=795642 RepID=A0A0S4QEH9_9ACTN|nr:MULTISPECIES: hypothetical protein [Parafrankia]CUU53863.1 hypothetical protein Ga0074812_101361 [Parafrankia irregularis]